MTGSVTLPAGRGSSHAYMQLCRRHSRARILSHRSSPRAAFKGIDGGIHGGIRPPSGLFLAETIVPAAAAAAQAIAAQELKLDSAEQRGAAAERRLAVAAAAWGVRKVRGPAAGFSGGGGCAL